MNGSDGSLILDTELDNSGFEKGTDKMLKAVENLTAEVKHFGTEISKSLQLAVNMLTGIGSTTDAIFEDIGQRSQQAANSQIQFVQATNQARQAVSGMAAAANNYDTALAKTQQKIDAQKAKLADYFKSMEEIKASTDETLTHAETEDQVARVLEIEQIQLQQLNEKYAVQLKTLHDLEEEYSRLAAAKAAAGDAPSYSAEDLKTVSADIEKASKAIDGYQAKVDKMRSVGASDNAWKSTEYDIQRATAALSAYRANLDGLKEAGKISPEDYERLSSALDTAAAKARELSNAMGSTSRRGSPFADVMRRVAQSAMQTAKNLARISFRALKNGFHSVTNSVSGYIRKAQDAKLQTNSLVKALTSVKRLLITRIKRTFISSIFNGAKEGLEQLAQYSSAFNLAMSNIKNSSKQLTANLSVALGGFIQKVEPFVTGFLNTLSKMISYVNAFFNIMQGKSTITVAKKQTDGYAQSLDKAAKKQEELNRQVYGFDELNKRSAKEEEEEEEDQNGNPLFEEIPVDELPETIKDFLQELKELWDNEDYFGFGQKLAEALNSAMQKADDWINNVFRPMGVKWAGIIAEVLNGLVDGFDADLFGKLVADSLNAVADIINTFITKFNWERLGEKVGEAIRSFFTNIDWELIGQTFANGWNALIDFIHGVVTTPGMWKSMGDAIGGFVATWFSGINFQKLGETLSTGINGIFTSVSAFTSQLKTKAPEIVKNLSEGINNLITGIDWAGAGQTLSDLITTLLGTILETAKRVDWYGIGRGIGEFLGNIDWGTIFREVGEIIWTALKGVLDGLFDTKSGRVVLAIGAGIIAIKGLFSAAEMAGTVATWVGAISGAFPGLLTAASGFVGTLGTTLGAIGSVIFSPTGLIIAAIAAAAILIITHWDEIKVAATQLKDWLATTWKSIIDFIKTGVDAIKDALASGWDFIKSITVEKWEALKNGLEEKFDAAKEKVISIANRIKSHITSAWDDIKANTASIWDHVKSGITQKFNSVKETVSSAANVISTNLTTAWTTISDKAGSAWASIHSTISSKSESVKNILDSKTSQMRSTMTNAWSAIQSGTTAAWTDISSKLSDNVQKIRTDVLSAWATLKTGTSEAWNTIKSTVLNLFNALKTAIHDSSDWTSLGVNLVEGLKSGISNAWNSLKSSVSSLASSLTSSLRSVFRIHSPSREWAEVGEYLDLGLQKGLEDSKSRILSTVANLAQDVTDEMRLENPSVSLADSLNGTSSEFSRIVTGLSQITLALQNVSKTLMEISGIKMPSLISGSVVPARIAVSDDGDVFNSSRFETFTSGLDERLYDQQEVLGEIRDILKRARLGIDADALADSIAFAMGNTIRGYGGI